ncbi:MAG: transcriptional activator NhaR [Gammaproteobacteria bacterium]|jgi:LysR family transcriptional regulator, transcriptional activator of nhaA
MINYKHLHYFWMVAKEGGIARASERLHLTPQTISGQISMLEDQLGEPLFNKVGRQLELTETGRLVLSYAEDIFALGGELEAVLRNLPPERPMVFRVGVADVVPKTITARLLAPALELPAQVRMICKENDLDSLLGELALHRLDLVIADAPIPERLNVTGYNHNLGNSGISFLATHELASPLRKNFPQSLEGAPLLIPSDINLLHSALLTWLEKLHIHPRIVGEFDDSALMRAFGQAGMGVFIAPTVIAKEIAQQIDGSIIGSTEAVRETYYAISTERRISHPAVAAITQTARDLLV